MKKQKEKGKQNIKFSPDLVPKPMKAVRNYTKSVGREIYQLRGPFSASIMPGIIGMDALIERYEQFYDEKLGYAPCIWCGMVRASAWDHLYSIRKNNEWNGYKNIIGNLVPSCSQCNNSRGNQHWDEWVRLNRKHRRKAIYRLIGSKKPRRISKKNLQIIQRWKEYKDYYKTFGKIRKLLIKGQMQADNIRDKIENMKGFKTQIKKGTIS